MQDLAKLLLCPKHQHWEVRDLKQVDQVHQKEGRLKENQGQPLGLLSSHLWVLKRLRLRQELGNQRLQGAVLVQEHV